MQLKPYLFFNGDCEAAFKFYERCFGGRIEAVRTHASTPAQELVVGDQVLLAKFFLIEYTT